MRVDVSEIKSFKGCKRQWQLSSRNRFHLKPKAPQPQLVMGTIFHEALAQLYLGVSLDKVMEMVKREMDPTTDNCLLAMIPGYYKNVLPDDLDRYQVLDVEHHFEIAPVLSDGTLLFPDESDPTKSRLTICGSIDLVVLDTLTNEIYGFEHKTCKDFRPETYLWMDEQPRVYTWALQEYVTKYNEKLLKKWQEICTLAESSGERLPGKPELVTLGGVYMNEVKKLLRQFKHKRTKCTYTESDLDNFMMTFFSHCAHCEDYVRTGAFPAPNPDYMSCRMCAFQELCMTYMYSDLDKDVILHEFVEEFEERTEDHLDEKAERSTQD